MKDESDRFHSLSRVACCNGDMFDFDIEAMSSI